MVPFFFFLFHPAFAGSEQNGKDGEVKEKEKQWFSCLFPSRIFSHCFSLDCDGVSVYAPRGERQIWSGITSPLVVFVLSLGGTDQESELITLRKKCVAPHRLDELPPDPRERQFWLALCPSVLPLHLVANRRHNENTFRFTPVNAISVLLSRNSRFVILLCPACLVWE